MTDRALVAGESNGEAGDHYIGLDRFGRVVDQRWVNSGGTAVDRYQYGYDRNSNRLDEAKGSMGAERTAAE